MTNKHKHLEGSHKDALIGGSFQPYSMPPELIANGHRFLHSSPGGRLLEKETSTDGIQPFGYVRPQFFRTFSQKEYPHVDDVKSKEKSLFGKKHSQYDYHKSKIGLELEFVTIDQEIKLSTLPGLDDDGYIHPMYEFFHQLGEIGTHADLGGIFDNPEKGLEMHYSVNRYISKQAKDNNVFFCPLGTVPVGRIEGPDVSTHNEYLRRISMWLSQRRNTECKGISDESLRSIMQSYFSNDYSKEEYLHAYTALYGVLTFQPMISIPNNDGDLLIQIGNFINGPILLSMSALFHSSPFWQGKYTGYQGYRFELRHLFETGLHCPQIPLWNDGTRSRVIKHLSSGEGINLGRAIVSDENICYSNSLFRIRPDISAVEIASFDSHPLPELRVAASVLLKILFHYVNDQLIHYGSDYLFQNPYSGVLFPKQYYESYASIAKYGLDACVQTKSGETHNPRKIIKDLVSTVRSYSHQQNFMSDSKFCKFVRDPIFAAMDDPEISSFDDFFSRSQDGLSHGSLSQMLVRKFKRGENISSIIDSYNKSFQSFYS